MEKQWYWPPGEKAIIDGVSVGPFIWPENDDGIYGPEKKISERY